MNLSVTVEVTNDRWRNIARRTVRVEAESLDELNAVAFDMAAAFEAMTRTVMTDAKAAIAAEDGPVE